MMQRAILPASTFMAILVVGCLTFAGNAGAYALGATGNAPAITTGTVAGYVNQAQQYMNSNAALPGAPSWLSGVFAMIAQWFQNVMAQGAQVTGAPVPLTFAGPLGSSITVSAQNLFAQFDAWLYGIIHFHIALILNFIVGLVVWVLGIAKNAVDWLNTTFSSAAQR
jgi:hypothetical protein